MSVCHCHVASWYLSVLTRHHPNCSWPGSDGRTVSTHEPSSSRSTQPDNHQLSPTQPSDTVTVDVDASSRHCTGIVQLTISMTFPRLGEKSKELEHVYVRDE